MNQTHQNRFQQDSSFAIFTVNEMEFKLNRKLLIKSQHLSEICKDYSEDKPIRIKMPQWVPLDVFQIFLEYMNIGNLNHINITKLNDQTVQRLLWLGDFLQISDLLDIVIKQIIFPRLNLNNCLLFLGEAYKKLKATQCTNDLWYILLNNCINFTSFNLGLLCVQRKEQLLTTNYKVLEEVRNIIYKMINFDKIF